MTRPFVLLHTLVLQYSVMKQAQDFLRLAKQKFPDANDYEQIEKALDFAATKHAGKPASFFSERKGLQR